MTEFYDQKETMTTEERKTDINRRISEMVDVGFRKSQRVRKIFAECNLKPADVRTSDDLEKLSVISREKLVQIELSEPPFGGFCAKDAEIDRIFISPGPVYEPHLSEKDPLWARAYFAAGFRKGDVVLNAFSYHMVAAGLTFHGGLRRTGATVVPSGASGTQAQVDLIRDLKVTGYTGTPTFLMAIIDKAEELGYHFVKDRQIKRASFAAEPLLPKLRERFEREYGIDTYQMYGATEVGDVAYECREKKGWHVCEEVFVEIVDPSTGKRVPDGQLGEIVVTRFNSVFFLFRFGTGDLSMVMPEPCACGRTSVRLAGIFGRIGDAVKVRGLFIAPSQVNAVKKRLGDILLQVSVSREGHHDLLIVRVESEKNGTERELLGKEIETVFKEICTLRIDRIEIVPPGELKAVKMLVDERTW